jgi:hypothetical protein
MKTILKLLSLSFLIVSCEHSDINTIDTIALVVPKSYEGKILIFLEQDHEKGKIVFEKGKHFIYIPEDGIILTKYKIEKGQSHIKVYDESREEKKEYGLIMNPQLIPDEQYDVNGGTYRGFHSNLHKDGYNGWINFVEFVAGSGKYIKNNYYMNDDEVREVYENTLRAISSVQKNN